MYNARSGYRKPTEQIKESSHPEDVTSAVSRPTQSFPSFVWLDMSNPFGRCPRVSVLLPRTFETRATLRPACFPCLSLTSESNVTPSRPLCLFPQPLSDLSLTPPNVQTTAIPSISTGTLLGSSLTATHVLAGFHAPKNPSYALFISAKSPMSVRSTVHLTTFLTVAAGEAACRMARRFVRQAVVWAEMGEGGSVEERRAPEGSAGSWPDM